MFTTGQSTDNELMAGLQDGDKTAFALLYDRYWEKLLAIAYNLTRDKSAAEEITQDVFISLWDRRKLVQIDAVAAYLATAVKFAVFKKAQKERRHREIERQHVGQQFTDDESEIDALFLREYINGLVEELPEKCRLVFRYSRDKGLSIPEIAEEMGIAEKTAEAHLTKALKILRPKIHRSGLLIILTSSGLFR